MPKSKRSKVVPLTRTKKKPAAARKQDLVRRIQDALSLCDSVWLLSVDNMRNEYLQELRGEWKGKGTIFFGRNKVMARAMGDSAETEYKEGLSELTPRLKGQVGLLLTSLDPDAVLETLRQQSSQRSSYLRSGNVAPRTVELPAGPLVRGFGDEVEPVPPSLEGQLRKLGMPVQLKNGKLVLLEDYTVCEEGKALTADGAHILKHFWTELAQFTVTPLSYWRNGEGVVVLQEDGADGEGEDSGVESGEEASDME
ncbi:mRNA turnover protein 4 [Hyaloraphidium curvatum]|nr:mRNA turnover protein 4 [Hyaloraphidium curvatum]